MPQASHRTELSDATRDARAVLRYSVEKRDGNVLLLNERQRLAMHVMAGVYGREYGDAANPGGVAAALGDGNGWTASVTLRALERRGLAVHSYPWKYSVAWKITDEGIHVLAQLDRQYEAYERCRQCNGEVDVRSWYNRPGLDRTVQCEACRDTGLRPAA